MIIDDNPVMLTCPLCGGHKYIQCLASGNTLGGRLWSDTKTYYPMLRQPSPVQRCSHCGGYYFFGNGKPQEVDLQKMESHPRRPHGLLHVDWEALKKAALRKYDNEPEPEGAEVKPAEGSRELSEEEMKIQKIRDEAWSNGFGTLSLEEVAEAEPFIMQKDMPEHRKEGYEMMYIHAYNDVRYGRDGTSAGTPGEKCDELFRRHALSLIGELGEEETLTAELWRELGEFGRCIELCGRLLQTAGEEKEIVKQILARAEKGDSGVFELFDEDSSPLRERPAED